MSSRLVIKLSTEGGFDLFSVVNQGPALPEKDLPFIGTRFFRASMGLKSPKEGLGLGIAIVQSIIKRHRGTLRFENDKDGKTKVTFYLPSPISDNK